jgi:hypothetical protein
VWLRAEQQVGDNDGGSLLRKMGRIQSEFSATFAQKKAVASQGPRLANIAHGAKFAAKRCRSCQLEAG